MIDTVREHNVPIWVALTNAQQQTESRLCRKVSSNLTARSSETDFSQITSSTSIHTFQRSCSSVSLSNRESDLRHQYEQRPEKLPDIAAEMEKWYAMTDR